VIAFKKGYMANWSEEIFMIRDVHQSDPPVPRRSRVFRSSIRAVHGDSCQPS